MSDSSDMNDEEWSDSSDADVGEGSSFKWALHRQISQVKATGSFATHEIIEDFVLPNISLTSSKKPGSVIRLPLDDDDAKTLIHVSSAAPFGRGTETIIDESIRKTWQIEPDAVTFNNPRWASCIDRIAETAAENLGVAPELRQNVRAEFYKMLIYEEGAMFKAHRDTEKSAGMFATLVICLPSAHTGGDVCLKHGSKSMRFSSSESIDPSFMAWYNDVEHEIEPVTSGYRWALIYNLVKTTDSSKLSANLLEGRVTALTQLLEEFMTQQHDTFSILYPLAHKYTQRSLKLTALRGEDFHRTTYIAQSCAEQGDLTALLADLELCQTDYQEDDTELPKNEVLSLTRIVDLDGCNLCPYGKLIIDHNIIMGRSLYKNREPDAQYGGGNLGNQVAEIDQLFHDSVVVILPTDRVWKFILGSDYNDQGVEDLMANFRSRAATQALEASSKKMLHAMCEGMIDILSKPDRKPGRYPYYYSHSNVRSRNRDHQLGSVAASAIFLDDMALFRNAVSKMESPFSSHTYKTLGGLIDLDNLEEEDNRAFTSAFEKGASLRATLTNLKSFRNGFQGDNQDRFQIRVDNEIITCLERTTQASAKDAKALIDTLIGGHTKPGLRQTILYQRVRDFIDRFTNNPDFAIPCLMELLHRLEKSTEEDTGSQYFNALIQRLLKPVISGFELGIYTSYADTIESKNLFMRKNEVVVLTNSIQTYEPGLLITFLERTRLQADNIDKVANYLTFVKDLIDALLPTETQHPKSILKSFQDCVYALLTAYMIKFVGHEPKKPNDWSRPDEIRKCERIGNACVSCATVNDFLPNPKEEECKISDPDDYSHIRYRYDDLETSITKDNKFIVKKTLSAWQKKQKEWEGKYGRALGGFRNLPSEKLKECLGSKLYEQVMDLQVVKLKHHQTAAPELASSMSRKRRRS